jgi:hypothetical protein
LFSTDAAAISLVFDGANIGTLGTSAPKARMYDELQSALGEGPCLDSVARCAPVVVTDSADPKEIRWPAYGPAMLAHEIRSGYAVPVVVAGEFVGALDLFWVNPVRLAAEQLAGVVAAAELAQMPLLDLLGEDLRAAVSDPRSDAWSELNVTSRGSGAHAGCILP